MIGIGLLLLLGFLLYGIFWVLYQTRSVTRTYFHPSQLPVQWVLPLQTLHVSPAPPEATRVGILFLSDYHLYEEERGSWKPAMVYGLTGVNLLANKGLLPLVLSDRLSKDAMASIVPRSFSTKTDWRADFLASPIETWICKKNLQRQSGILITRDKQAVLQKAEDFTICQELLLDPFLVGGHKINLRVYLFVVFRAGGEKNEGVLEWYVYQDGFLYYAPKKWDAKSLSQDVHVTTGYIDRAIYEKYPMTLGELETHLGESLWSKMWNGVLRSLRHLQTAYEHPLREIERPEQCNKCILLGVDMAPHGTDPGMVKIMEVNKGPDLRPKDGKDGALKKELTLRVMQYAMGEEKAPVGFTRLT